jgi:hypothetical protein
MLSTLEDMTPGTDEYDKIFGRMMASLRAHNDDEEVKDLPLLEPRLGEDASKTAAAQFSLTKKFVPTRFVIPNLTLSLLGSNLPCAYVVLIRTLRIGPRSRPSPVS